jgi:hypothetical protein
VIANFLTKNGLTEREIICHEDEIDDDFSIASTDLTSAGLALMRAAYDKWLTKVDEGMPPEDTRLLARALNRIRSGGI